MLRDIAGILTVFRDTGRLSLASMDSMALASKQMQETMQLSDTSDQVLATMEHLTSSWSV